MKKKIVIVVSIIIAIVLVAASAAFIVPKILLHKAIEPLLDECSAAEYVTDFSIVEENGITVSNDYFSVVIPEGYTKKEGVKEELKVAVYENVEEDNHYMIFDEPSDLQMSLLDSEYYDEKISISGVEIEKIEEIFAKQGYPTPNSYYNITKATLLLDKADYKFWSLDNQVLFSILGVLRVSLYEDVQGWIYERDNIRAIILRYELPENWRYTIDVMKEEDLNSVYGISFQSGKDEDAWKLLNSLEFH